MSEFAPTLLFKLAQLLAESPGINYYVDGTNGSDANHGKDWAHAFQTIQQAITTQIANTSNLGDVIYIAPGNYAESLTGDLTRVALIGVSSNYPWHIVSIRPTAGSAYHGTLFEAMFKNLCFLSSDTTNKTLPAVLLDNARYSIIEDCHFVGRDPTCVEGLQIGPTAIDDVTECHLDYCIIRRNRFDTWYGTASEFTHAIKMGDVGGAGGGAKQVFGTTIEDNIIYASSYGIYMLVGTPNADFTIVRRNLIDSMTAETGCSVAGIEFTGGNFPAFADNRINAADAIIYPAGGTERTFFNCVTNAGAGPVMELPVST
uniref:Putative pectate lyase n=1 Tax=viral metagenome TaxID=1070528 RepID=A0A6M3LUU0_9ZZZZ